MTYAPWRVLLVGVVASVPVAFVLVLLHRANERQTRRNLAGIVPQQPPERATGHSWAFSDAGARVGPALGATGHSRRPFADVDLLRHYVDRGRDGPVIDGQWRSYGYEVPDEDAHLSAASARLGIGQRADCRDDDASAARQTCAPMWAYLSGKRCSRHSWRRSWRRSSRGGSVVTCIMWAIVGAVGGLAVAWLAALGLARQLVWRIERFIGDDADDDDAPDDAETHLMAVQADAARQSVATETRQRSADARLLWLISFVARCYTVGTSESAQGIKPGERAKYLEARDLLFRLGLAEWRDEHNKRLGWDMTTNQAMTVKTLREHVTAV